MKLHKFIVTTIREYLNDQKDIGTNLNNNFWKWFNGSQMLNVDGSPKIYYNGNNRKFNTFKYDKIKDKHRNNILGFFFSENKKIAEMYGSDVKPCFLKMKKPKRMNDIDFQMHLNYTNINDLLEMKLKLINDGYDGIDYGTIVIVFYPTQIKSIENDGTWDIMDNNIYS